jgi:glycosyltransferase involved in cell wall biosynthesis
VDTGTSGSVKVTVITPTLPERVKLLEECSASVEAQTIKVTHLVAVDGKRFGPQRTRNNLAKDATTEWLLPLDDDDVLDPDCCEQLVRAGVDADVVYPWTRMDGRTDWCPNRLFNAKMLFRRNFIPNTALIRRDMFNMVGGYHNQPLEDWELWQRIWLHGGRFKCVPEVLWTYRFHDGNQFQSVAA